MCTIHADSSHGVFRRIASYAVQSPQRLPLEATNLLVAGAVDLVVFLDMDSAPEPGGAGSTVPTRRGRSWGAVDRFPATLRRRFVSSVLEVVDADGLSVVSNEVFRPGPGRRAEIGAPLRSRTFEELVAHGFDPAGGHLGRGARR